VVWCLRFELAKETGGSLEVLRHVRVGVAVSLACRLVSVEEVVWRWKWHLALIERSPHGVLARAGQPILALSLLMGLPSIPWCAGPCPQFVDWRLISLHFHAERCPLHVQHM
jgi:hypothetical protein